MTAARVWAIWLTCLALFTAPSHPAAGQVVRDDLVDQCVRVASWAACDPARGYIAGPGGPCAAADLACVRREWRRIGDPNALPFVGPWCGRSHEDGGTLVPCGGSAGPLTPEPPPPPPAPTRDEAIGTCPQPGPPIIHRDPDPEGLTGLATYLWAGAQAARSSAADIRGYPVTCSATPVAWRWETGDGATYARTRSGSAPPDHAVSHVYETRGDYTQRLTVSWRLTTNYGESTVTRAAARPYKVIEVRSTITN